MKSQDVKKVISKLPDTPGVYVFKCEGRIVYIGKATSLRDRVRSYFSADIVHTRSPLISKMLGQFDAIEHIKTDSVLEALILEAHLIKKHQPEANIKEKDNKSFNFVIVTKEDFPRVLIARGRELLHKTTRQDLVKIAHSFGPFPNAGQLRDALKIIRKMFPYRDDKCTPCSEQVKRQITPQKTTYRGETSVGGCKPCFNRQIGLCPGVCTGEITKEEYRKQIDNIILFFEGNKKRLVKNIEKQMKGFAKNHEFEKANLTKRTLFALKHIQDISLIKEDYTNPNYTTKNDLPRRNLGNEEFRIESYDIAHISGTNVVGVMTVVEDGEVKKSDYRKFKIKDDPGVNDTKALSEVLSRRLAHIEWRTPDLIVVDGGAAQKRVMEKIIRQNKADIPVVSVVKDEHHRPKQILGDKKWLIYERAILLSNSEAHRFAIGFHKQLRGKLK